MIRIIQSHSFFRIKQRVEISSSSYKFYEKTSAVITTLKKQEGSRGKHIKQIMKVYENHQLVFLKYDISNRNITRVIQRQSLFKILHG